MKISDITYDFVKDYCKIDYEEPLIPVFMAGAKSYLKGYTGIKTDIDLDTMEDMTICYLVLISDFNDNRGIMVKSDKANKIIDSILSMHCINLL